MKSTSWLVGLGVVLISFGCALEDTQLDGLAPPASDQELSVGDIDGLDDIKADGWGYATMCKPIPDLELLVNPAIVVSLDGLTLHLVDRAGTYDRTFPIGVGSIEDGVSLTPTSTNLSQGVFYTRTDLPPVVDGSTPATARFGWNYSCRMWWRDENNRSIPVFAGLPFIRLEGPSSSGYGIHGPVDHFNRSNGGDLRRGYVSHGCIRMDAADLVEVYARIQGHRVPVRVQKAIERDPNDRAIDVDSPWIFSECRNDGDCAEDLNCEQNPYSGRGFCTQTCQRYCPDRYGYPTTFCVQNPNGGDSGICVFQSSDFTNHCRRFDHFTEVDSVSRFSQPWVKRDVCLPGSQGWIGDRCLADRDCLTGDCAPIDGGPEGICTESCTRYCPDRDGGYAVTFCIDEPDSSGGMCTSRCDSNDDCPLGTTCEAAPRHSQPSVVRNACVPY